MTLVEASTNLMQLVSQLVQAQQQPGAALTVTFQ